MAQDDIDTVAAPYFDGLALRLLDPPDGAPQREALARFLALGPKDRQAEARHVLAYWRDLRAWTDPEEMDAEVGAPPDEPDEVWAHVEPRNLSLSEEDGQTYVILEAECAWEPEHGLMMVWRGGDRLVKVGTYDGHLDDHGDADDAPIFVGLDAAFTTTRSHPDA